MPYITCRTVACRRGFQSPCAAVKYPVGAFATDCCSLCLAHQLYGSLNPMISGLSLLLVMIFWMCPAENSRPAAAAAAAAGTPGASTTSCAPCSLGSVCLGSPAQHVAACCTAHEPATSACRSCLPLEVHALISPGACWASFGPCADTGGPSCVKEQVLGQLCAGEAVTQHCHTHGQRNARYLQQAGTAVMIAEGANRQVVRAEGWIAGGAGQTGRGCCTYQQYRE
jgi:hypothetical protein